MSALTCLLVSGIAHADVLIALPVPSSGSHAAVGRAITAGAERAAREINARGGIAGEKVAVRSFDDGCTAATAAGAANRIVTEKPALVLGHPCSGGAIAAARIYGPARVLFIATEARHADFTDRRAGQTIFRLSGRDDSQGDFAGHYLAKRFPGRRIAVVSDRTSYSRRIVERARAALIAAGNGDVVMLTIVAGEKDYGPLIARIRDCQCAAVLFAGFPVEAASILRQMRAVGLSAPLIGTNAVATDEFGAAAGQFAEGTQVLVPSELPQGNAASGDSAETAETASGSRQPGAALRAHAAVELWAAAASTVGSANAEAVAAALARGSHPTTSLGPVAFDAKGDARLPSYVVRIWRDGRWSDE